MCHPFLIGVVQTVTYALPLRCRWLACWNRHSILPQLSLDQNFSERESEVSHEPWERLPRITLNVFHGLPAWKFTTNQKLEPKWSCAVFKINLFIGLSRKRHWLIYSLGLSIIFTFSRNNFHELGKYHTLPKWFFTP